MSRIGPGYVFSDSISNFNWITWFNPNSKILVLITGGANGLGLNPLPTLDWNRIGVDVQNPTFVPDNLLAFCNTVFFAFEHFPGSTDFWRTHNTSDISSERLVFRSFTF